MKLTRKMILDTLHHDLKGFKVEVKNHSDPTLIGLKGIIGKETRSLLYIETDSGIKQASKTHGTFRLFIEDTTITINGSHLEGDAKRRSKRKLRHW